MKTIKPSQQMPSAVSSHDRVKSWERAVIYNPEERMFSIKTIKKVKDIEKGKQVILTSSRRFNWLPDKRRHLLKCPLPPQKYVDVFLEGADTAQCTATAGHYPQNDALYVGRIGLGNIGIVNGIYRKSGHLRWLYVEI